MGKTVVGFAPKPMKLSVLTAALQELTPRDTRDADPDLAYFDNMLGADDEAHAVTRNRSPADRSARRLRTGAPLRRSAAGRQRTE